MTQYKTPRTFMTLYIIIVIAFSSHSIAQTPPEAEPVTISVEIVSADITHNQIQVRLEPAEAGRRGGLGRESCMEGVRETAGRHVSR